MTEQQAMRMALEALEDWKTYMRGHWDVIDEQAITALRQALAVTESHKQQPAASHELLCVCGCTWEIKSDGSEELISSTKQPADELLRLRDLLGKANALARIRANEIELLKAKLKAIADTQPAAWVGLDRKEMLTIIDREQADTSTGLPMFYRDQAMIIARAIEAALRSKNT